MSVRCDSTTMTGSRARTPARRARRWRSGPGGRSLGHRGMLETEMPAGTAPSPPRTSWRPSTSSRRRPAAAMRPSNVSSTTQVDVRSAVTVHPTSRSAASTSPAARPGVSGRYVVVPAAIGGSCSHAAARTQLGQGSSLASGDAELAVAGRSSRRLGHGADGRQAGTSRRLLDRSEERPGAQRRGRRRSAAAQGDRFVTVAVRR